MGTEELRFRLVYYWVKLTFFCRARIGVRPRLIGFMPRKLLRRDRTLNCEGLVFYFSKSIAGSYGMLLAGYWNEPETHIFLRSIFSRLPAPANFLDIGANIGEMIIDVARLPNVGIVIGIEPHPQCAESCRRSVELNDFSNVVVKEKLLSNERGRMQFFLNPISPNASCLSGPASGNILVESSVLDDETASLEGEAVLLIDVEGAELDVVMGGRSFIDRCRPLIIFEYNVITKRHFHLNEMAEELGPGYRIYRLRSSDGRLDGQTDDAWNCVAVPQSSVFSGLCGDLTCAG